MKVKDGIKAPCRATTGSAGYDFFLPCTYRIAGSGWVDIDTGVTFEEGDIPEGYFLMLMPKSGLGFKYGMQLINTVGVIDSDYRNTVRAKIRIQKFDTEDLYNESAYVILQPGSSFMQGILVRYGIMPNEVPPSKERTGGFGSTS